MLVIVNVVNGLSVVHPDSPTILRGGLARWDFVQSTL